MIADILGALAYIPEGWTYEFEGDAELTAAVGEAAGRMARSVEPAARVKP